MHVALGCLSKVWPDEDERYHTLCTYYSLLLDAFSQHQLATSPTWLSRVGETSRDFLSSNDDERRSLTKLLDFGRRRCENFLTVSGRSIPLDVQLLGMEDHTIYIRRLRGFGERIEYLREVAANAAGHAGNPRDWIIVCKKMGDHSFATALPSEGPPTDRRPGKYHCQWHSNGAMDKWFATPRVPEGHEPHSDWKTRLNGWMFRYGDGQKLQKTSPSKKDQGSVLHMFKMGKDLNFDDEFEHRYVSSNKARFAEEAEIQFNFMCGDPDLVALYYRRVKFGPQKTPAHPLPKKVSLRNIMKSLEEGKVSLTNESSQPYPDAEWYMPLQALGVADKMLQSVGTSSMNVTTFELESSRWFSMLKREIKDKALPWYVLPKASMSSAFGCIVFFDTGDVDLDSSELKDVMAVSVDDSIYLSATLTSDPYDTPEEHTIHRTLGNVGKPGVSLLIPPANPRMRKAKSEEWHLVNHYDYDFRPENSFQETSLHLWLTEYRVPYATNHRGSRNLQAFFQEAVISVHDRSNWVGDLDIIKALRFSPDMVRRSFEVCHGKRNGDDLRKAASVDNYYELFDQLERLAIVRSHGNWLGRLATAVLSVQLGIPVVILPGEPRAQCSHKNRCVLDGIRDDEHLVIY